MPIRINLPRWAKDAVTNIQNTSQAAINNVVNTVQTGAQNVQNTINAAQTSIGNLNPLQNTALANKFNDIKYTFKNSLANMAASRGFVALVPYKQLMRKVLEARGHQVSNTKSIKEIALMFYRIVIMGKNNFEYSHFQHVEQTEDTKISPAEINALGDSALSATAATGVPQAAAAGVIVKIVAAIIAWIAAKRSKKDAGQPLTPEETLVTAQDALVDTNPTVAATPDTIVKSKKGWLRRILDLIFGSNENFQAYQKAKRKHYSKVLASQQHFRRRINERNVVQSKARTGMPVTYNATEMAYGLGVPNVTGMSRADKSGLDVFRKPVMTANDIVDTSLNQRRRRG